MTNHLPSAPGEMIADLPRLLPEDAQPRDGRLVVIGLSEHVPGQLILVAEWEPGESVKDAADAIMATARVQGAEAIAVVVYAADAADHFSLAAQHAAAIVLRAAGHGLTVLDALRVTGDRWASYVCQEPSCCPPEGSPIPTPEEPNP